MGIYRNFEQPTNSRVVVACTDRAPGVRPQFPHATSHLLYALTLIEVSPASSPKDSPNKSPTPVRLGVPALGRCGPIGLVSSQAKMTGRCQGVYFVTCTSRLSLLALWRQTRGCLHVRAIGSQRAGSSTHVGKPGRRSFASVVALVHGCIPMRACSPPGTFSLTCLLVCLLVTVILALVSSIGPTPAP